MRIKHLSFTSCVAALVLAISVGALAQLSQRGSINGVLTEASGVVVQKSSVTLLDLSRNQTSAVTTTRAGTMTFPSSRREAISF